MNTITTTALRTLVAGAILGAVAFSFAAVSNAVDSDIPLVMVKFADLDVSTSRGAASLYGRIHGAAANVCSRMYVEQQSYKWHQKACMQTVIGDAVTRVNRPALSAIFASNYGASAPLVVAASETR